MHNVFKTLLPKDDDIYGLLTKCEVKMAGYWPNSFFCEFMDLHFVPVHKHAAILTGQTWSIRDLFYGFREFFLRDTAGSPERALHLARSGSQSQRTIWVILPARGASHIYNN